MFVLGYFLFLLCHYFVVVFALSALFSCSRNYTFYFFLFAFSLSFYFLSFLH